ncbi:hypothetical protein CPC197_0966A, partial [Chlamydia psittaci C1/97]
MTLSKIRIAIDIVSPSFFSLISPFSIC